MSDIKNDPKLVAFCGLYCAACGKYQKEKCAGCAENSKATWCKLRSCCLENGYTTCADCEEFGDPRECAKFNNFMSRIFGFIFRSDRPACIDRIKAVGVEAYAEEMSKKGLQSIKR